MPSSRTAPLLMVCAALALTLGVSGCGGGGPATAHAGTSDTVPVAVHRNAAGAVIVLAPVYIDGHGPYRFIVDTGASRSIIDEGLAHTLGLHVSPSHAVLTGVTASSAAGVVSVSHWRIGKVSLPAEQVLTLSLASDRRGPHLGGLIGSDNLSRFGSFTLDYAGDRLVLH